MIQSVCVCVCVSICICHFIIHVDFCNNLNHNAEWIHPHKDLPCATPLKSHQTPSPTNLISIIVILSFQDCEINGIIQYGNF